MCSHLKTPPPPERFFPLLESSSPEQEDDPDADLMKFQAITAGLTSTYSHE